MYLSWTRSLVRIMTPPTPSASPKLKAPSHLGTRSSGSSRTGDASRNRTTRNANTVASRATPTRRTTVSRLPAPSRLGGGAPSDGGSNSSLKTSRRTGLRPSLEPPSNARKMFSSGGAPSDGGSDSSMTTPRPTRLRPSLEPPSTGKKLLSTPTSSRNRFGASTTPSRFGTPASSNRDNDLGTLNFSTSRRPLNRPSLEPPLSSARRNIRPSLEASSTKKQLPKPRSSLDPPSSARNRTLRTGHNDDMQTPTPTRPANRTPLQPPSSAKKDRSQVSSSFTSQRGKGKAPVASPQRAGPSAIPSASDGTLRDPAKALNPIPMSRQSIERQSGKSIEKKKHNTGTLRAPRQRLADRGFNSDAPSATPRLTKPKRRLTGGDTKPSPRIQPTKSLRKRPSLPGENSAARRLDMDLTPTLPSLSKPSRSTESRAKAMNAIAESTIGSARMDIGDLETMAPAEPPVEHVVPRTPQKHSGVLESFRRTRRASQEAEMASKEEAKQTLSVEEEKAPEAPIPDRAEPTGALGKGWITEDDEEVPRRGVRRLVAAELMTEELVRRGSGRFSEGAVTLTGVSKLRESLGRRRSRGGQDLQEIAPPQLRRKSLKLGQVQPLSVGFARLSTVDSEGGVGALNVRSPLGDIASRGGSKQNVGSTVEKQKDKPVVYKTESSRLKPFSFDDDRLSWADTALDDDLLSS